MLVRADADRVHVAAEHGVVPDRGILADLHVADDLSAFGDEHRRMESRGDALEGADAHAAAVTGGNGRKVDQAPAGGRRARSASVGHPDPRPGSGGRVPSKFTVRFSGVRPKRRAGRTGRAPRPAPRPPAHLPAADLAGDPPLELAAAGRAGATFTSCGIAPHSASLRLAIVRGRGEKTKENWFSKRTCSVSAQRRLEVLLGLAGEADDDVGGDRDAGARGAQSGEALEVLLDGVVAAHRA